MATIATYKDWIKTSLPNTDMRRWIRIQTNLVKSGQSIELYEGFGDADIGKGPKAFCRVGKIRYYLSRQGLQNRILTINQTYRVNIDFESFCRIEK